MSAAVLALWIALIGADRIDLLGGHGAFVFTPFLALTPFVIASELARRGRHGVATTVSRDAVAYAALGAALLAVVITSTLLSDVVMVSGARSSLLVFQLICTFVVALLTSDRADRDKVLAIGAVLALPLFLYSDVMEVVWFFGRGPELVRLGPATLSFNDIQTLGFIPRLGGPVGDGNRAGFVLLVYLVFIARGIRSVTLRRIAQLFAALLLVATISRSAALATIGTAALSLLTRRHRVTSRGVTMASVGVLAALAVLFIYPRTLQPLENLAYSPLASRVSTSEGSARSHVELLQRGVQVGTESVGHSAIGLGYGTGYRVLQDVFPGNKYGNFHSLYVTVFAESGVVALVLVLALLAVPLVRGGRWRPLVAGAAMFNIFYQTTAEPIFWFLLAAAWLSMPPPAAALSASVSRETGNPASVRS